MRIGKFKISKKMIDDCNWAGEIFSELKFVPFKVEFDGWNEIYEYIGCSPKFSDVPDGSIIPEYKIIMNSGNVIVRKEK